MIKHVVCFKLKDNSQDAKEKATNVLMSMITKVPQIWGIEVGQDFLGSNRSYDIILQVVLESKEKLEEYQQNEYHVNVVKKYMHAHVESSVAVDYEIQ
ncbi:MAG: Dabb family protein [Clostridia bacterium]|nr:Dabb family protein [Clostridia bacterium]